MLRISLLFIFVGFSFITFSKEYLVFFSDKLVSTEKAMNYFDVPVNKIYLNQLNDIGDIINKSNWLNGIHLRSELSKEVLNERFPFISSIITLKPFKSKTQKEFLLANESASAHDTSLYDKSYDQLEITRTISCMHNNGYDGNGVLIAVLDAGFPKLDTMLAFKKMRQEGRIIDTWDFQDNTPFVYHKSTHGTFVSSIVGGQLDSNYIGSAPKANYAFYITEITSFERNIEEFNLVLGLERADSIGADIASISLGYRNFDSLQVSYGYSGMDGKTTIVAQGVSIAQRKGMIVSVAAGNRGSGIGTISSPCDADSVLCVGAIRLDSTRAGFSSEGPTFDGRTKPEVVTVGEACAFIGLNDTVRWGNGTSFSTPLFSGLVACLVQAHPQRSNYEIMDAIKSQSHQNAFPDNALGWGIPNACKIDSVLSILDSLHSGNSEIQPGLIATVYPNPVSDVIHIKTKEPIQLIEIFRLDGGLLFSKSVEKSSLHHRINFNAISAGVYLIKITSADGRVLSKKIIKE